METADIASAPTSDDRPTPLERYHRDTDLPLMALALCVIPLVLVEIFVDVEPRAEEGLEVTYALIWLAFAADYAIRFALAPDKRAFFLKRRHLIELALIPLTLPLPIMWNQVLRAARVVRLTGVFARGAQRVVSFPREANSQLAVGASTFLLLTLVASVLALALEEGRSGSQINTMGDALWWAVATVSTIGYGDVVPHTSGGRILAFALMLAGVGLVGVVVANLASRVMSGVEERLGSAALSQEEAAMRGLQSQLVEINERLARLEDAQRRG